MAVFHLPSTWRSPLDRPSTMPLPLNLFKLTTISNVKSLSTTPPVKTLWKAWTFLCKLRCQFQDQMTSLLRCLRMILIWLRLRANCLNNSIKSRNSRRRNLKPKTKSSTKQLNYLLKPRDIRKRKTIWMLLMFLRTKLKPPVDKSKKRNSIRLCSVMVLKTELIQRKERKLQAEPRLWTKLRLKRSIAKSQILEMLKKVKKIE